MKENELLSRPGEIVEGLETLIGREGVSEDYVRFRIELLTAQASVYDVLSRRDQARAAKTADVEQPPGSARIEPGEVPFDAALAEAMLDNLCAAFVRRGRPSEDLARLSAAVAAEPGLLEGLARGAAFDADGALLNSICKRIDIDLEAMLFFGRALAAPFVTQAVRRHAPGAADRADCSSGGCPWCGSAPGLAKLGRADGRRVLCCSLCGQSWQFARVECPFCRQQGELDRLLLEDDDLHFVESCRQCKRYLKTVDQRQLPDDAALIPLVTTTATLHLDLMAREEGCVAGPPYVALR